MKIGKSFKQREAINRAKVWKELRRNKKREWWFAWHPVYIWGEEGGYWVWLKTITRWRNGYYSGRFAKWERGYIGSWDWDYLDN